MKRVVRVMPFHSCEQRYTGVDGRASRVRVFRLSTRAILLLAIDNTMSLVLIPVGTTDGRRRSMEGHSKRDLKRSGQSERPIRRRHGHPPTPSYRLPTNSRACDK